MKIFPTKLSMAFICLVLAVLYCSCTKDSDLFADAIYKDPHAKLDEFGNPLPDSESPGETPDVDSTNVNLVTKYYTFEPKEDAYLQDSDGIDHTVMRLQESNRTIYVLFDLSQIPGEITSAELDITVDSDEGDGTIEVYKGTSSNWTEDNLSGETAPDISLFLGSINKAYSIGTTETINLDVTGLKAERTTLILTHSVGNDLAIASKENSANKGPKLKVVYKAPPGSSDIIEEDPVVNEPVPNPEPSTPVSPDYPQGGVKASTFGYNSDDATLAFVSAINSNNEIIIIDKQVGDWIIRPTEIRNLRNKTIYFEEGVVLRAKSGSFGSLDDRLLKLVEAENVQITGYGAEFKMNKSEYTSGEHRHALQLSACRNVSISGLKFSDSGGDGIYVAGNGMGTFSQDIYINDVICTNNRRQGISIISVENLYVKNSIFKNTIGALPEAGVDIEPNNTQDRIVNVNFDGCTFTDNNHSGIALALMHLTSSSLPVSIKFTDCYLSNNHGVNNEYVPTEIDIKANRTNPVKGEVLFENIIVENSKWGLLHAAKLDKAFHVTLRNVTARNIVKDNSMPAIKIRIQDKDNPDPIGGFTFDNVLLEYEGSQPYFVAQGSTAMSGLRNVNGDITVKSSINKEIKFVDFNPINNLNVNINYNFIQY